MDFQVRYREYAEEFERALLEFCDKMQFLPERLKESMRYSLTIGGKRLRPVLFLSALDMFGLDWKKELNIAIAIECIHTYSLIHDDLPAMDNDDFRRGKPSNHKMFGEAHAILAGDALLNLAYSMMFAESARGEEYLRAARYLCDAAGAGGMIAGQSADLLYTANQDASEEELRFVYDHKTGKLIVAPLVMAAMIAGVHSLDLEKFGEALGSLFQLTDDILDEKGDETLGKTLGKDKASDKLTIVKLYGLNASELQADLLAERCRLLLEPIERDTEFFRLLVDYVRMRKK
ncbi:MAG: polyprenyl synthetase family protein [Clostridia bacterium]|nr:polyprenyl synthetase family protein [Clostridia bacterium]